MFVVIIMQSSESSTAFREHHRAYGLLIPIEEVSAHLACGWRLADPEEVYRPGDYLIMREPGKDRAG